MQRTRLHWFRSKFFAVRPNDSNKRFTHKRRLLLEWLEVRQVLSASPTEFATPDYLAANPLGGATLYGTVAPTGYSPQQVRSAYGFDQVKFSNGAVGNGAGTTIAIVDAYDDPNIISDLQKFDATFGIPNPPTFTKVNQTGGSTMPAANKDWAGEIALDVEWAHAIAPGAKILLVEANSSSNFDLYAAVDYARKAAGVVAVSMSWSSIGGEPPGETNYDSYFTTPAGHTGVSFIASSGDHGAPAVYPSSSPNVVSVGGTTLHLSSPYAATLTGGLYGIESGWSSNGDSSGGGISNYESQPSYQSGIVTQTTTKRATPDVSYDSDSNTGFPVYDSYNNGTFLPWREWGGTSAAAPQWAALVAIADQGRTIAGLGSLDSRTQLLPALYKLPASDFHDVTTGKSTGTPNYSAGSGYDLVTGRGTPIANLVIRDLVRPVTPVVYYLSTTATSSPTAGSLTVIALGASNQILPTSPETIHFATSDLGSGVVMPPNYTFSSSDSGAHTFTGVTLVTTGPSSISAKDEATSVVAGSANNVMTPSTEKIASGSLTRTVSPKGIDALCREWGIEL